MILQRYIVRDILRHFGAILGLILVIFLASRLVESLAEATAGRLAVEHILAMLALKTLGNLGLMSPLCFFLAAYLAINRLTREHEMVAMWNAGFGRRDVARTTLALGAGLGVPVLGVTLLLAPWAERQIAQLELLAQQQSDLLGIAPGRFKELSRDGSVIYVEDLDSDLSLMRRVFLQVRQRGETAVLNAEQAKLVGEPDTGERFVVFSDGRRYTGEPGGLEYTVTRFERYAVRIEQEGGEPDQSRARAMPTLALFGSGNPLHRAEWQWRLSPALSLLPLSLLAVHMVGHSRRSSYYAGLLTAVMVYFLYSNLVGVARSLLKRDAIPPWLGLWWVHLLALVVVVMLARGWPGLGRWWRRRAATP